MEETTTSVQWRKRLAPFKKASVPRAVFQVLNTAIPLLILWVLMARALEVSFLLTLLLAIPAGGLMIRLFIFQHDCGHGSFLPSQKANNLLGTLLGIVTFFPYGYWRRTHAIHHATSGNLDEREFGDIATLTVKEYQQRSWWGRLGYRLYRHPAVFMGLGPVYQILLKHRFPFDIPWSWKREWRSVLVTNLGIAAALAVLVTQFGWRTVVMVQLPVIMVTGAVGIWLFYVQHQFEGAYWDREEDWDFYKAGAHGSSFYDLPRVLHWFTGNIGYHHIHHLSSRIPNYRLADCHRATPDLEGVTRLTLHSSLKSARLRLWDEEERRLISFRELRQRARSTEPIPQGASGQLAPVAVGVRAVGPPVVSRPAEPLSS